MLDLVSALARPIAKLLLKSWLGETAAAAGDNLLKLAFDRLGDRNKARAAQQRANAIAEAVVRDLEGFFANERVDEEPLEAAAFELGETLAAHVDAAFLVHQKLNAADIRKGLLAARPVARIYRRQEPEHGLYLRLVEALAPRLRAVAPELPDYTLERDSELLDRMARVADDAQRLLAEVKATREETARTRELVEQGENRRKKKRSDYEDDYRTAVRQALDYVDILGLDVERARREVKLSIAYLSLTTNVARLGRVDFETLLDLLPAFGNRLLIEGAAGSGKSTLLRWTAVEATAPRGEPMGATTAAYPAVVRGRIADLLGWPGEIRDLSRPGGLGSWHNPLALGGCPEPSLGEIYYTDPKNPSVMIPIEDFLSTIKKMTEIGKIDFGSASLPPAHEDDEVAGVGPSTRPSLRGVDIKRALRGYALCSRDYWRAKIPFLIRLRHLKDGLPQPDDLPAHLSTALGRPPEDWVSGLLRGGGALLLIDGVDEVPEGDAREAVLNSIGDYVALYGRCPVIVASRPRAFDKARLRALRFIEAEVDELTPEQRARFIDSWHRALAVNLGRAEDDPDITGYAEQLKGVLDRQPHIGRLATNPLLCAGICALHERNPETLPKDEYDLCAKLTEMLVELRDRSHGGRSPSAWRSSAPPISFPTPTSAPSLPGSRRRCSARSFRPCRATRRWITSPRFCLNSGVSTD